jgi:hypothetical protein
MRRNIMYALGLREPEELPIIDQKINAGVRDVLRRTSCHVQCIDADVPDGASRIEFGPGILKLLSISRGGILLQRVTPPAVDLVTLSFAQRGNLLLFSEPFAVGEQLQMYAVAAPTKLSQPTDALENEAFGGIPEEFQDAVETFAKANLAELSASQASANGTQYWMQYFGQDGTSGRIADIRRQVNKASGMTLGPAQIVYGRSYGRIPLGRGILPP